MIRFGLILLSIFGMPACEAIAQGRQVKAGLEIPFEAKFNFITRGSYFRPFQSIGVNAVLQLTGSHEDELIFQLKTVFRDDLISYPIEENVDFILSQYTVSINPQIMIPLRQKINYVVGFGIDWVFAYGLSLSSSGNSGNGNLDKIDAIVNTGRPTIPFINTGFCLNISSHILCGVNFRQTFLNYFGNDNTATFEVNNHQKAINLSYQPTYIGIELCYFFVN